MLIIFFRAIILYILIIFSLRLMGKRQIGELQPADLVATILISNIAALPIEDTNIPMLMGAIPILALVGIKIIFSNIVLKNIKFRNLVTGQPVIIVKDGVIDQLQLHKLRYTIDDVHEAMRSNSIFDIRDVHYAIVETSGSINFLQKFEKRNLTPELMQIKGTDSLPPHIIISDGRLLRENLHLCGLGDGWLEGVLKKENKVRQDIFLMTADNNAAYHIVMRENRSA
ncbi:MAG: DUF421 domain-containing protein [Oscillospiraceae bacterium]|nr:DUF421 domain-containing protein [Oscillospiraceae bacterium]